MAWCEFGITRHRFCALYSTCGSGGLISHQSALQQDCPVGSGRIRVISGSSRRTKTRLKRASRGWRCRSQGDGSPWKACCLSRRGLNRAEHLACPKGLAFHGKPKGKQSFRALHYLGTIPFVYYDVLIIAWRLAPHAPSVSNAWCTMANTLLLPLGALCLTT